MARYERASDELDKPLGAGVKSCLSCGAVVVDPDTHDRWHEAVDGLLGLRAAPTP